MAASVAHADIYTWVDKDGVTNVSNEAPPEGVRVTKVVRAAARDPAREAAARQAELRALRERVEELTNEVERSRHDGVPPPGAAAPALAFAPPAPPAPTVVVTVINQPAPQPEVVPAGCDYAFGACGASFFPGYTYYAPLYARPFQKPQHHRKWATTPTRQGSLIPPLIPYPATMRPAGGRAG